MSVSPRRVRTQSPGEDILPKHITPGETTEFIRYYTPSGNTFDGEVKLLVHNYTTYYIKHGFGHETFYDGSQYEGLWHLGKMHGEGMYVAMNGDMYQGNFD